MAPAILYRIRTDELLWALGAFAEVKPSARDVFVQRLVTMRDAGFNNREIGENLGRTRGCIAVWVYNLKLPLKQKQCYSFEEATAQNAIIKDLWMTGMAPHQIGKRVKLNPRTVYSRAIKLGLPKQRPSGGQFKFYRRSAA